MKTIADRAQVRFSERRRGGKEMKKPNTVKYVVFAVNSLLCIACLLLTAFLMSGWGTVVKTVCYAIPSIGLIFGAVVFACKKEALLKSCFVVVACAFAIILAVSLLSKFAHLDDYPTDGDKIERLTQIIRETGEWGMLVYVFIQVLQVVILPLPAAVCYVPGSQIWGAGIATLLASLGVLIGSVIAYLIGRVFGKKVVIWIAGKETTEKYAAYIGNRGKVIFVLMQILPFFPDDILCMVAGLTSMNFPFFVTTMVLVRPIVIAAYCFLGEGTLIPFSGWGIAVWVAIFALCIALAILSFKYQDKFEKWLVGKFTQKKRDGQAADPEGMPPEEVSSARSVQDVSEEGEALQDGLKGERERSETENGDGE